MIPFIIGLHILVIALSLIFALYSPSSVIDIQKSRRKKNVGLFLLGLGTVETIVLAIGLGVFIDVTIGSPLSLCIGALTISGVGLIAKRGVYGIGILLATFFLVLLLSIGVFYGYAYYTTGSLIATGCILMIALIWAISDYKQNGICGMS